MTNNRNKNKNFFHSSVARIFTLIEMSMYGGLYYFFTLVAFLFLFSFLLFFLSFCGFLFDSHIFFEIKAALNFFNLDLCFLTLNQLISNLSFIKFNHEILYTFDFFNFKYNESYDEAVSFLRFPYFDDGSQFIFGNMFPYGVLGFGYLDTL